MCHGPMDGAVGRGATVVCGFNNRNAQKCAIAHLIRHSGLPELAIERKWGFRSCSAADNTTVAGWCVRWYMHIVEPWRLFLLSSASLCGARGPSTASSRRARMACAPAVPSRAPRSAASACRHLQRVVVHGRAESLSTDSAEGTVAPLRDLYGRGERIEEVQIAR